MIPTITDDLKIVHSSRQIRTWGPRETVETDLDFQIFKRVRANYFLPFFLFAVIHKSRNVIINIFIRFVCIIIMWIFLQKLEEEISHLNQAN
jgi:hypothetical protein